MLRQPQSQTAAETRTAEITGLTPAASGAALCLVRAMRHQHFGGHGQQRGGHTGGKHQRTHQPQRILSRWDESCAKQARGRAQCPDQIPATRGESGVDKRCPRKFPGLRQELERHQAGNLLNAETRMRQHIGQRH